MSFGCPSCYEQHGHSKNCTLKEDELREENERLWSAVNVARKHLTECCLCSSKPVGAPLCIHCDAVATIDRIVGWEK